MLFWANKISLLKVRYYAFISNEKKDFHFLYSNAILLFSLHDSHYKRWLEIYFLILLHY